MRLVIQLGVRVCVKSVVAWYKVSYSSWSRQWMELKLFVAVLLRITLTVNNLWINLGMPANSGEPSAMINLATNFVYILLMGGRRGMKSILAAVQAALQIYHCMDHCVYVGTLISWWNITLWQCSKDHRLELLLVIPAFHGPLSMPHHLCAVITDFTEKPGYM